jgi:hypothetical protein
MKHPLTAAVATEKFRVVVPLSVTGTLADDPVTFPPADAVSTGYVPAGMLENV